jgi:hypothetical protein
VGARRDDITSQERAQIAIAVLSPDRVHGTISCLAAQHAISRQTVYTLAAQAKQRLLTGMEPEGHGPVVTERTVSVDRNRLARGVVILTEVGVSQRDISRCLEELLDTEPSAAWVNAQLAKLEEAASRVNSQWQPQVTETLSGDEIYSNGSPNLLLVGNDSLYIYALTRQSGCDGETWGCVLLDAPPVSQFSSDGGKGLAAGAKTASVGVHQLDWDHLLRPLWGQAARLEQQAYAALEAVEERVAKFDQSHTTKRLEQHLAIWEKLTAQAEEKVAQYDAFRQLAQQVDAQFALIDLTSGELTDPATAVERLRQVGRELQPWTGRIYQKLSSNLLNWADALFGYPASLRQALAPQTERWGAPAVRALSRIWQIEAHEKRHPLSWPEKRARQALWAGSLDEAVHLLGAESVWIAWEGVSQVLGRSWRGSMLAECINSLLRPILDGRKHTDQGCLELFRFLHNVRPFKRGKRAHHSPAGLAGLHVPDDPLILLGLASKCQSNFPGF